MTEENWLKIKTAWNNIVFVENGHKYYRLPDKKNLISVTTLLGFYKPKFQYNYWLKKKAEERGILQAELKAEWDYAKELGLTLGSYVHKCCEDRINRKYLDYERPEILLDKSEEIKLLDKLIQNFLEDHSHYIPVANELVVGNNLIAGQIDYLTTNKIVDFKTDKKIEYSNKYQTLKYPLNHLDDCEFNKYSLQVSIYRYLLEEQGIILPENDEIIWFNFRNPSYKKIQIPYLKDDILKLFDHAISTGLLVSDT